MDLSAFLTRRWNYRITVAQGLPTFLFAAYGIATPFGQTQTGMIVLSALGALFWLVLELHSNARFARERKIADNGSDAVGLSSLGRLALVVHSLLYWFFLVPFLTPMSYGTGFAIYSGILFSRFLANTWINVRDFNWQEYQRYSLRIP